MVIHRDETNISVVRDAIDVLNSGEIDFSPVGGAPTDHYYGALKEVVYQIDVRLGVKSGELAANTTHIINGSPGFLGAQDVIGINAARIVGYSVQQVTSALVHELYHEDGKVDKLSQSVADQIMRITEAPADARASIVRVAEELTIRSIVDLVSGANPELVDSNLGGGSQIPTNEEHLKKIVDWYNDYHKAGLTSVQIDKIVAAIKGGALGLPAGAMSDHASGDESSDGSELSAIGEFFSDLVDGVSDALSAIGEGIGGALEAIGSAVGNFLSDIGDAISDLFGGEEDGPLAGR
jgi:hypothetical protein